MKYYNTDITATSEDELMHYGVLGMKWGVKRGRSSQAYEKASKKLNKLNDKIDKVDAKKQKLISRQMRSLHPESRKAQKRAQKIRDLNSKQMRITAKTNRWYNSMEKTFSKTDIKMTEKQQAIGRRYTDMIARQTQKLEDTESMRRLYG